jgi:hypothetical protein
MNKYLLLILARDGGLCKFSSFLGGLEELPRNFVCPASFSLDETLPNPLLLFRVLTLL